MDFDNLHLCEEAKEMLIKFQIYYINFHVSTGLEWNILHCCESKWPASESLSISRARARTHHLTIRKPELRLIMFADQIYVAW